MNSLDASTFLDLLDAGFCLRLTMALLCFAGQGLVIGLVALAANRSLRGASSRMRYGVNVAALALMVACLPTTFTSLPTQQYPASALHAAQSTPTRAAEPSAAESASASAQGQFIHRAQNASRTVRSDAEDAAIRPPARAIARTIDVRFAPILRAIAPAMTAIYLSGVAFMLLRVSAALWGGHRLRRSAVPVEDAALLAIITRQARRLGMRTAPAIAWCQRVSVPVVVGLVRPLVLLPASLASGLSLDQLEALLTHELAHIRRYDLLVNLLQRLAESLLFFHPAVWYVSRQISVERESCCDDLVVATGCGRLQYADALVRMAEFCAALGLVRPGHQAALLAASGDGPSQLKRRVLHLLEADAAPRLRLTRSAVLLTALLPVSILLAPALLPGSAVDPLGEQQSSHTVSDGASEAVQKDTRTTSISIAVDALVEAVSHEAVAFDRLDQKPVLAEAGERLALFMMDLSNGNVALVAREPMPGFAYCGSASWSHDGRRVLFDATPADRSNTHLHVIDTAGGHARLTDLGPGNCPSLSPDGTRIAFLFKAGASSQRGIWVMQSDGSGRQRLADYGVPRWSPDGRQLLISSFGTPCHISLVDDGGVRQPVWLAGYEFRSVPQWAGDGTTLLATVHSAAGFEIVLVDVSRPEQAQIRQVLWRPGAGLEVDLRNPRWGNSCPAAAYHAASGRCVFIGWSGSEAALYTFRAGQADPPRRLEAGDDNQLASLAFSPDGRYLLFCSDRHERWSTEIGAIR